MWEELRPATQAEKALLIENMRNSLFDPYSVRDVEISTVGTNLGADQASYRHVCVRLNAKNRMGAYVGRQATQYIINSANGVVANSQTMFTEAFCNDVRLRYSPFPEVERIGSRS
ncbi:MAG: hypothetical protein DI537_34370 [Stutzerimonas stutzeri]|nr:MAG: hypothetical protein DI537_34370 [Stutzerimonas stutzeri]